MKNTWSWSMMECVCPSHWSISRSLPRFGGLGKLVVLWSSGWQSKASTFSADAHKIHGALNAVAARVPGIIFLDLLYFATM
jgi:hypothetical protein